MGEDVAEIVVRPTVGVSVGVPLGEFVADLVIREIGGVIQRVGDGSQPTKRVILEAGDVARLVGLRDLLAARIVRRGAGGSVRECCLDATVAAVVRVAGGVTVGVSDAGNTSL